MPAFKDLTGQRLGKWVVVGRSTSRLHPKRVYWDCVCDCGTTIPVCAGSLGSGRSTSCGYPQCYGPKGEQGLRAALKNCKKSARQRGKDWTLTDEQARRLLLSNCAYCDAAPANETGARKNYAEASKDYHTAYTNGIDRVDNSRGYEPSNCVACCPQCNYAKHTRSLEEFKEWVCRVYATITKEESRLKVCGN